MKRAIQLFAASLPLVFGLAFLAPLIDQGMQAVSLSAPFGLSTLALGLIIGGSWGLFAIKTGRWI